MAGHELRVGLPLAQESQLDSENWDGLGEWTHQGDMWSLDLHYRKIQWQQLRGTEVWGGGLGKEAEWVWTDWNSE